MARLMLVESDPAIAEIFKSKLEGVGFEVVIATTGKEVLKLASESKFNFILLDMVLPEMNGLDVLKELKQNGNYGDNPKVYILSSLDKKEHEEEALKNGADGYISKTQYSPSQLAVEIQRMMREYEEQEKNKERLAGKTKNNGEAKKQILFIEDEEVFLEMFGKKLEDDGFAVDYAKNGAWGSKMAAEKDYDLIITDLVMPAMSGDEIIRRIKLDEKSKDIPIIVLSASINEEDAQVVKEFSITDFYGKTKIVPSDLSRRVGELLK